MHLKSLKEEEPYGKKVELYLEHVKVKQQSINLKQTEMKNEERLSKMIASNHRLAAKLGGAENEFLPLQFNRSKAYGDEYLKESLLRIKKTDESQLV